MKVLKRKVSLPPPLSVFQTKKHFTSRANVNTGEMSEVFRKETRCRTNKVGKLDAPSSKKSLPLISDLNSSFTNLRIERMRLR